MCGNGSRRENLRYFEPLILTLLLGTIRRLIGTTVKLPVSIAPLCEAVIITAVFVVTTPVKMVNVALACPAAIWTVDGTGTTVGLSLVSVIVAPLLGA